MNARTKVELVAIVVGSGLALWLLSYWIFAPMLARLIGNKFTKDAGPLAEAEAKAWKEYRETGIFPGVDEELLGKPGWENALAVPAERPFAKKAVERG